jgi:hypothetical protein
MAHFGDIRQWPFDCLCISYYWLNVCITTF